jgi:hypothetical protein
LSRLFAERLQTKTKEFTLLAYTGLVVELEHLKIETRLMDEKFVNVIGKTISMVLCFMFIMNQ